MHKIKRKMLNARSVERNISSMERWLVIKIFVCIYKYNCFREDDPI
jgi:hypothetical protein